MPYVPPRIRLAVVDGSHDSPKDLVWNKSPRAWRATDWRIDVCILDASGSPVDLTGISQLTLEIRATLTGSVLLTKTLAAGALTLAPSKAAWEAGTAQHGTYEFVHGDTAIAIASGTYVDTVCIVKGVTSDDPGKVVSYGYCTLRVEEGGVTATDSPTAGDPDYYTAAQCDARFTQVIAVVSPLAISGSSLAPIIRIAPGTVQGQVLIWDDEEEEWTTGSPNGDCYVENTSTGKHHRVTASNDGGLHLVVNPVPID